MPKLVYDPEDAGPHRLADRHRRAAYTLLSAARSMVQVSQEVSRTACKTWPTAGVDIKEALSTLEAGVLDLTETRRVLEELSRPPARTRPGATLGAKKPEGWQ